MNHSVFTDTHAFKTDSINSYNTVLYFWPTFVSFEVKMVYVFFKSFFIWIFKQDENQDKLPLTHIM